jgi:hypothetical protein
VGDATKCECTLGANESRFLRQGFGWLNRLHRAGGYLESMKQPFDYLRGRFASAYPISLGVSEGEGVGRTGRLRQPETLKNTITFTNCHPELISGSLSPNCS